MNKCVILLLSNVCPLPRFHFVLENRVALGPLTSYHFMVFPPFISDSYYEENNENFSSEVMFLFPGFDEKGLHIRELPNH